MKGPTVAALICCHNRRETTLASLRALFSGPTTAHLRAFLVDDGSTDGTTQAVQAQGWPVKVIAGDGSLFWAAAMALAERSAMQVGADFLLWLNDDTVIDETALDSLLSVSADFDHAAIVVAATRDPETGDLTYGGRRRTSRWHPQRLALMPPSPSPQTAETFNGNLVLVPRRVRLKVGPIDGLFPHAYADDDYGLRATRLGISVIQAPGTLATCPRPEEQARESLPWSDLQQPQGLPLRAQARFFRRHGGPAWPLLVAGQQAKWLRNRWGRHRPE